jgi:hypothetical protein
VKSAQKSQVRFPLHIVIGEIANMLREGYIVAKYSSDEHLAPLHPMKFSSLHHYWFGATDKGTTSCKSGWFEDASTS